MTARAAVEEPAPALDPGLMREVAATPAQASALRGVLADWVHARELPDELADDVKLAAYEAMVNVVEHAYPTEPTGTATFTLTARLRRTELTVSVTDHGRWLDNHGRTCGGRGLPLIRALAPDLTIGSSATGTTITMTWPAAAPATHNSAPAAQRP